MKLTRKAGVVLLAVGLLSVAPARGGWFGSGPKTDTNEQLAKLFGANSAFTATATITVKNQRGRESQGAEMTYAFSGGKMRTEIDIAKTKAGEKRPAAMEQMTSMGMNVMVNLIRPDKKMTYVIYPGLKGYCEFPQTTAAGAQPDHKPPTIERTEIGRETIDGHPCVKYRVTVTEDTGVKHEMLVWQATDLNEFPVQSQMKSDSDEITTRFKDIKLGQPAAALFELPEGFQRYGSMQEMMMGGMKQMMPGAGGE